MHVPWPALSCQCVQSERSAGGGKDQTCTEEGLLLPWTGFVCAVCYFCGVNLTRICGTTERFGCNVKTWFASADYGMFVQARAWTSLWFPQMWRAPLSCGNGYALLAFFIQLFSCLPIRIRSQLT